MPRRLLYWLPVFIWMGVIFYFSAQPALRASAVDWQDLIIRKLAHVGEFFVLSLLIYFALSKTTKFKPNSLLLISLSLSLLYAVTDETHQLFVPGREGKYQDVLIDSIGIISAYWVQKSYMVKRLLNIP